MQSTRGSPVTRVARYRDNLFSNNFQMEETFRIVSKKIRKVGNLPRIEEENDFSKRKVVPFRRPLHFSVVEH